MKRRLMDDLARWERGEIRAEALAERHPKRDVSGLVEMHAWLAYLASEVDEEPGPSWDTVANRLLARCVG